MSKQEDSIFVDQDESMVAVIGTNYIQNFLSGGSVEKSVGVLTPKRFYFKGQNFSGTGKDMAHTTEEGVVSIEDITFTRFIYARGIGLLIFAVLVGICGAILACMVESGIPFFAGIVVAIIAAARFFVTRSSVFQISFPGGSFGFDIRYYPIADIRDFQRQVHLMKDHLKENA